MMTIAHRICLGVSGTTTPWIDVYTPALGYHNTNSDGEGQMEEGWKMGSDAFWLGSAHSLFGRDWAPSSTLWYECFKSGGGRVVPHYQVGLAMLTDAKAH